MTPSEYLRSFVRHWWVVVAGVVAGMLVTLVLDVLSTPTYTATSSVLLSATTATDTTSSEAYTGTLLAQQRVLSYASIARGATLAGKTVDDLGLRLSPAQLLDELTVVVPTQSTVMMISVDDASPSRAEAIAGGVAQQLAKQVDTFEGIKGRGRPLLRASVIGNAGQAVSTAPPAWRNPVLGAAGGLVIGLAGAVLLDRFRRRLYNEQDVREVLAAPLLVELPVSRRGTERSSAVYDDAVRRLRTAVYFMHPGPERCMTVTLTSPHPLGRRPSLVRDLASSLADTGARVLLVEADLHGVGEADPLDGDADREPGLAEYLSGEDTLEAVIRPLSDAGVHVVSAGHPVAGAADLLHSPRVAALLHEAAKSYDFVLLAAPATSVGTDAAAVAARCDGAVLTARRGRTSAQQLYDAKVQMERVGAVVQGIVLVS